MKECDPVESCVSDEGDECATGYQGKPSNASLCGTCTPGAGLPIRSRSQTRLSKGYYRVVGRCETCNGGAVGWVSFLVIAHIVFLALVFTHIEILAKTGSLVVVGVCFNLLFFSSYVRVDW